MPETSWSGTASEEEPIEEEGEDQREIEIRFFLFFKKVLILRFLFRALWWKSKSVKTKEEEEDEGPRASTGDGLNGVVLWIWGRRIKDGK